ncbi:tektin-3-like isoform X2 [Microplitis mediator]|uniref:tektin-3-like isoform X2 n=1 Tax=Microplitis mediator TaxID=375433 RepID=UPI002552C8E3|nr:tektin-3-like isoform X2 [Microplitis mediator]
MQLQPWRTMGGPVEKNSNYPIPTKVGGSYKTPRSHPWRPTVGFENVQVMTLPSQTITNQLVDPCYTPSDMATEPLKFPNLVTGFERNPSHAARAALYTRYTPDEWNQKEIRLANEVTANCNYSDKLKNSTLQLIKEADEKVQEGQRDSSRMLGQRVREINFWERELSSELDRIIIGNNKMQECMRTLQRAILDVEIPQHISQECLYHRESRRGTELIHDEPERALLSEVETIRNCRKKLEVFTDKCKEQLANGRAAQNEIEMDINNKNLALGIDSMCHQLNNYSRGLQYYGGIENYDNSITEGKTWAEASDAVIRKSQIIRAKSNQIISDIEAVINEVAQESWKVWDYTNNAFARRIAEILEAKNKLLVHLQHVQSEIFSVEKNIEEIKKAVNDKALTIKVAHTRLEARTYRPQAELCKDAAQLKIVEEVETIKSIIGNLNNRLLECEAQQQQLLRTRSNLENDLKDKMDALFIDREKCMGLRKSYPIVNTIKY